MELHHEGLKQRLQWADGIIKDFSVLNEAGHQTRIQESRSTLATTATHLGYLLDHFSALEKLHQKILQGLCWAGAWQSSYCQVAKSGLGARVFSNCGTHHHLNSTLRCLVSFYFARSQTHRPWSFLFFIKVFFFDTFVNIVILIITVFFFRGSTLFVGI